MTSKLTREENVQAVFDLKAGYTLGIADVEILKRVARMALAAMDSEPVGTLSVRAMSYSGKKFGTQFGFVHSDAAMKVPEGDYPLYRHAQPAPVVPDEIYARTAFEAWYKTKYAFQGYEFEITDSGTYVWDNVNHMWNGYRSAMLAAAPQSPGSEPATVPGKWITVSERMPENDVSVLTFDGMYRRVHHAMYGHWQCWEPEKITHWMPLPAAPQEVPDGQR